MASVTEKAQETAHKVKEGVKESLVGTEEDAQLPAQMRAEFMQHAIKDEETGEYYMGQKEFVDAIAPMDEDYVRIFFSFVSFLHSLHQHSTAYKIGKCKVRVCEASGRSHQHLCSTRSSASNIPSSSK